MNWSNRSPRILSHLVPKWTIFGLGACRLSLQVTTLGMLRIRPNPRTMLRYDGMTTDQGERFWIR